MWQINFIYVLTFLWKEMGQRILIGGSPNSPSLPSTSMLQKTLLLYTLFPSSKLHKLLNQANTIKSYWKLKLIKIMYIIWKKLKSKDTKKVTKPKSDLLTYRMLIKMICFSIVLLLFDFPICCLEMKVKHVLEVPIITCFSTKF